MYAHDEVGTEVDIRLDGKVVCLETTKTVKYHFSLLEKTLTYYFKCIK